MVWHCKAWYGMVVWCGVMWCELMFYDCQSLFHAYLTSAVVKRLCSCVIVITTCLEYSASVVHSFIHIHCSSHEVNIRTKCSYLPYCPLRWFSRGCWGRWRYDDTGSFHSTMRTAAYTWYRSFLSGCRSWCGLILEHRIYHSCRTRYTIKTVILLGIFEFH